MNKRYLVRNKKRIYTKFINKNKTVLKNFYLIKISAVIDAKTRSTDFPIFKLNLEAS
jgi:hypothetical protein